MKVRLAVVQGPLAGQALELDRHAVVTIGRSSRSGLQIPGDPRVSRNHCVIEVLPPRAHLRDLGSANGTLLNDLPVSEAELRPGDRVGVGSTVVRFEVPAALASEAPAACARCGAAVVRAEAFASGEGAAGGGVVCAACQETLARLPEVIPGHRIVRKLGEGNMGSVFLAANVKTGVQVAVKTLKPSTATDPVALQMFLREATSGAQLDHPNAVRFHGSGYTNGLFYFLMDFVDGPDLARYLETLKRPLSPAEAAPIMGQLLDVLDHAHSRKLVHRDIKPANVLLERSPPQAVAKLADFGLMRRFESAGYSFITRTGEGKGTPQFMPPEQIEDARNVGPPADVYSLASTFFFMLALATPIEFRKGKNHLLAIMEDEPRALRAFNPAVTPELEAAIATGLLKDPARRHPTAAAFKEVLGRALLRGRA